MRLLLIAVPLALAAAPAFAAPHYAPAPLPRASIAMPDQMGRAAGAVTRAFLNLPVGEIQAAIEGRPANDADRRRTVRDLAGRNDPYLDRRIEQQAANSGAAIQAGARAMAAALPSILGAIQGAADEIDRATANLPDPNYPRR